MSQLCAVIPLLNGALISDLGLGYRVDNTEVFLSHGIAIQSSS
jgi:hypothetical protein